MAKLVKTWQSWQFEGGMVLDTLEELTVRGVKGHIACWHETTNCFMFRPNDAKHTGEWMRVTPDEIINEIHARFEASLQA